MAVALPTYIPRWASLFPWVATTWVVAGERVTNDGGKIYQCITPGNTGNMGGPTGVGADIPDPGAVAPAAHWMYVGLNAAAWAAIAYAAGTRVTNAGNLYMVTTSPGGASAVAPTGMGPGPLTTIDGYVWQYIAAATAQLSTPSDGQADVGWVPGQYPPAQVMNKLLWGIYRWIVWLKDLPNQAITWTAHHIFTGNVQIAPSAAGYGLLANSVGDNIGVSGNATGTAPGVRGVNTTAVGVEGYGGTQGVLGHGNAGAAVGVEGRGDPLGGTGQGVKGVGGSAGGEGGWFESLGGNAPGVHAKGVGTGAGVDATVNGAGPAIKGTAVNGQSGPGGRFLASNSAVALSCNSVSGLYPPFQIEQQALPPAAISGCFYVDSSASPVRLYFCKDGATWTLVV